MPLYKDIDLDFNLDASGDIAIVTDVDAVNQGLRILLETALGQRPGVGNEYFGLSIRKYLFNELSVSVAENLAQEIGKQIRNFEPRIEVQSINVDINEDLRAYLVEIVYTLVNSGKIGAFRMVVAIS